MGDTRLDARKDANGGLVLVMICGECGGETVTPGGEVRDGMTITCSCGKVGQVAEGSAASFRSVLDLQKSVSETAAKLFKR